MDIEIKNYDKIILKGVFLCEKIENITELLKKYHEDPTSLYRETSGRKKVSLKSDKSKVKLLQEQTDYLKMENIILKKWGELIKENN